MFFRKHLDGLCGSLAKVGCALIVLFMIAGCVRKKGEEATTSPRTYAVVGIEGDIDSFNPLFAEDVTAGELNDLFYPGLMSSSFNKEEGVLEYHPLLANSWGFENGDKDIRFHLKSGVKWEDGADVTAQDVQFSYQLYADTAVASVRQSSVDGLRRSKDGFLNIKDAVQIIDDTTVIFHFERVYPGQLFDAGLPILPSHIFASHRGGAALHDDSTNHRPLSCGPFRLKEWLPMQQVVLVSNGTSTLPAPAKLTQLIYRVIPDYHTRLMQFLSGELDVLPYLDIDDVPKVQESNSRFSIIPLGERFYDAVNWNNIDPAVYTSSKGKTIKPNPLFGDVKVRRALTMAINRGEIVDSYLKSFGREAIGPVSPLFRWAFNDTLKPLPFDLLRAKELLSEAGWKDVEGRETLEKGGKKFSFVLKIPAGNELRQMMATIIQNQLRTLKIEVNIEQLDRATFWSDLMDRKFDAAIAGFNVPLQMQLDELWGSDLSKARFNLTGFQNARIEEILEGARHVKKETDHAGAWKEFQVILQEEQPCTFLYWLNDLVAINNRLQGTNIGVLGISYHAGDWYLR